MESPVPGKFDRQAGTWAISCRTEPVTRLPSRLPFPAREDWGCLMPTIIAQKDNQGILLQTHTRQGIQNHPDRLIQRIQHRHVQASFMVCLPGIFLIQMLGSLKGPWIALKGR